MNEVLCPKCHSSHVRRGGTKIWLVYLLLIAFAVVAVVAFHFNGIIVAGVVLAGIVLAHLVFGERVCLDCGTQWKK